MEQLTACGWFEALPAEAAATIAAEIARCEASRRPLHEGLVGVVVDSRYLLAERPALELLDQFARASWGALRIDSADQTRDGDGVVLRWVSGGRPYTLPLPNDLDEVPLTFFALVNRALADGGSGLRFQRVEQLPWGALESFVLTTPEALARAADQRLVPVAPSAEPSDEELEPPDRID